MFNSVPSWVELASNHIKISFIEAQSKNLYISEDIGDEAIGSTLNRNTWNLDLMFHEILNLRMFCMNVSEPVFNNTTQNEVN